MRSRTVASLTWALTFWRGAVSSRFSFSTVRNFFCIFSLSFLKSAKAWLLLDSDSCRTSNKKFNLIDAMMQRLFVLATHLLAISRPAIIHVPENLYTCRRRKRAPREARSPVMTVSICDPHPWFSLNRIHFLSGCSITVAVCSSVLFRKTSASRIAARQRFSACT